MSVLIYALFIARTAFIVDGALHFTLFDDGMISMRYARNLAEGYGLTWNPGEAPVEGYTNLLWTLWMAVLHLLPVPESGISLLVMISAAATLIANLFVVRALADRVIGRGTVGGTVALVLTALYYPLMFWTLRGMEVGLLVLLVGIGLLGTVNLFRRFSIADLGMVTVAMVLAILTRPDAVIPFFLIAVFAVIGVRSGNRLVTAATLALAFVGTMGGITLFRMAYYHDVLPNTYYLKMKGAPTFDRVVVGLKTFRDVFFVHLFAPVIIALPLWKRLKELPILLLAGIFSAQCAYSVYVGGDAWEYMRYANRYIAVGMPALFILCGVVVQQLAAATPAERKRQVRAGLLLTAAVLALFAVVLLMGASTSEPGAYFGRYSLARLVAGAGGVVGALFLAGLVAFTGRGGGVPPRLADLIGRKPLVLAGVLLIALNGPAWAKWTLRNADHLRNDVSWARLGMSVRSTTTPDASIAVVTAGALPYYSHRRSFDLLGKSDTVIAKGPRRTDVPAEAMHPGHDKWDYAYSFGELKPDLIVQLWYPRGEDHALLARLGYSRLSNGMFVHADALARVDTARLVSPGPR